MQLPSYTIGLDFGSASMRCLIVDCADGREVGTAVYNYPNGTNGVFTVPDNPHVARQNPRDFFDGIRATVPAALQNAAETIPGFHAEQIVGIGVDATASTPIPLDDRLRPLAFHPEFQNNLAAYAWMWKDHSAAAEAVHITEVANRLRPHYLAKSGGSYSSENFFAKILRCLHEDPAVFNRAYAWLEFADVVTSALCGLSDLADVRPGLSPAAHKALYSDDWGGYPDKAFLTACAPELGTLRLPPRAYAPATAVGPLCDEWATALGLPAGIPVTVGLIDAHGGAIGAGVGTQRMSTIIGTSTGNCLIAPAGQDVPDIPGVLAIANHSVIPGHWCVETGQTAVGDIFNWFVTDICQGDSKLFRELTAQAAALAPGQNGLVALDWHNGSRCVLIDAALTGTIIGLTLHSTRADIFRAWLESTVFGTRAILQQLAQYGLHVSEIVASGGIAEKNPFYMQLCADILNCRISIAASSQTCALGAAITAMVAAGLYPDLPAAQTAVCRFRDTVYTPIPAHTAVYDHLFKLYMTLLQTFGSPDSPQFTLMKELLALQKQASNDTP